MGDNLDSEAEPAPPPSGSNRVEISVAAHSVSIESGDPLADVVGYALTLYEQTTLSATRIPFGFDTTTVSTERAEPYVEPGSVGPYEEGDDAGRLGSEQLPTGSAPTGLAPAA